MTKKNFFSNYYKNLTSFIEKCDTKKIVKASNIIKNIKKKNKLFLIGNGGSSSIASHVATDLTKIANIRSVTFNETNLITCFSNDYGYENWASKAIEKFGIENDICILISSSGKSKNIINAAKMCKNKKIFLITFSGFNKNNQLRKLGNINFWVNSSHYNYIEMTHHIWLVSIADYLAN
tara:strand:- start:402 stop:938 length:537 start_codon:yes stop_codon:yes gene_type:complete